MNDYPKRPKFFAYRFIRTLTKTAAAMDIGSDGCWLLSIVALQEDACHYRRPVMFYNDQLCGLMGQIKRDTLIRVRDRCMESKWLCYESRGTRRSGLYFVLIPAHAEGLQDGYIGESIDPPNATNDQLMTNQSGANRGINPGPIGGSIRDQSGDQSGTTSSLSLPLAQIQPLALGYGRDQNDMATPSNPRQPKTTARDLFALHQGHIKSYGKEAGIAAFSAALELYKPEFISRAIKEAFIGNKVVIPSDDILDVCYALERKETPPIPAPDRLGRL